MMERLLHFDSYQKPEHNEWLMLVHGAGGSTRTWKRQIESLGDHYNLLVIDLPGHGGSKDRSNHLSSYSFELIGEKIWEVIDSLKIRSVHLVGISLGSILCLQMRHMRPDQVSSVILPGAIVSLNKKLKVLASFSLKLAKLIGYRSFYKMSAFIMMPRGNHKQSRDVFVKESKVLTVEEFKKWTHLYYNLNSTLKTFFMTRNSTPHLLVMGNQDHLFLPPARSFVDLHENAALSVIEDCGHVVSIEKAEQFNEICLSFLEEIKKDKFKTASVR